MRRRSSTSSLARPWVRFELAFAAASMCGHRDKVGTFTRSCAQFVRSRRPHGSKHSRFACASNPTRTGNTTIFTRDRNRGTRLEGLQIYGFTSSTSDEEKSASCILFSRIQAPERSSVNAVQTDAQERWSYGTERSNRLERARMYQQRGLSDDRLHRRALGARKRYACRGRWSRVLTVPVAAWSGWSRAEAIEQPRTQRQHVGAPPAEAPATCSASRVRRMMSVIWQRRVTRLQVVSAIAFGVVAERLRRLEKVTLDGPRHPPARHAQARFARSGTLVPRANA